jgi:hypothetical protein
MPAAGAKSQTRYQVLVVSQGLEQWSKGVLEHCQTSHLIAPLLQILGEYEFCALAFVYVINFVKGIANQK